METPTEKDVRAHIRRLVQRVDLETTSTKQFAALLSEEMGGIDLGYWKKFIKTTLKEIISEMDNQSDEEVEDEEEDEKEETRPKKKKKGGGGGGGGLAAVKEISDELSNFLGQGKYMARTAIVKALWDYIRENDLQDRNDKRKILLDDDMQRVFGTESFTMFTMNKYIGAHIDPFKPVDLTSNSSNPKKRKAAKSPNTKNKDKKPRKAGTQAPYRLSVDMARVAGKDILPRPQVTKALWVYIRRNNLQNPNDKREILCDKHLRRVMGGKKKVTMFSMNKYITPHLIEKLDKSNYIHEMEEEGDPGDFSAGGEGAAMRSSQPWRKSKGSIFHGV